MSASPAEIKLLEKGKPVPPPATPASPTAGEFDAVIAKFATIKDAVTALNRAADTIDVLRDEDEQVTDEEKRKVINAQLEKVLIDSQKHASASKLRLDEIKKDNEEFAKIPENQNGAKIEMRQNLYNASVRKFAGAMEKFNTSHQAFKERATARQRRRLKQLEPNLPDETVERLITEGNVQKVMAQVFISDNMQLVISEIEERHHRVQGLEREIREVYELFKNLALLVDIQQDSLDVIGKHITNAKDYAEKGADHLKEAEKHQETARKRQCCILIIVLVVLGVILGPTLVTVLNKS